MPLLIPKEAREPLAHLARLSPPQREQLLHALTIAAPATSPDQFAARLSQVDGLERAQQREIIITLMSLYHLLESSGRSIDQVVADIGAALHSENVAGLSEDQDALRDFQQFLVQLLSFDQSVGVTTKAGDVLIENENNFGSARVVTDLRPIFLNRNDPEPRAVIAVHMLKIEVHESNREFFFALDSVDIRTLQQVLQRAEAKEQSLRRVADAAGLTWIER